MRDVGAAVSQRMLCPSCNPLLVTRILHPVPLAVEGQCRWLYVWDGGVVLSGSHGAGDGVPAPEAHRAL